MEVDRLKVDGYGPLRDFDHDFGKGFTLLHGGNESGKTLLVEAFVKMLLDADAEGFEGVERVKGAPAGYLRMTTDDGAVQMPDADLDDVFPEEARTHDVRNAFVVRDVDLRRPMRSKDFGRGDYLRDVTDRVLGARTGEIEELQQEVAEIGELTPSYEHLRDRKPEHLKTRVEEGQELVEDLESYLELCRSEGVLDDHRRLKRMEAEMEDVEDEIELMEKARESQQVDDARDLVDELEEIEDAVESHGEREDAVDELRGLEREVEDLRRRREEMDVDPEVLLNAVAALGLLFALSLLAAVVSPVQGMLLISGVLLAALLYVGQSYLDTREVVGEDERLVREANYLGVSGSTLPEVYTATQEEIDGYEEERRRLERERERVIGRLQEVFDAGHDTVDGWQEEVEGYAEDVEAVDRSYSEEEHEELRRSQKQIERDIEGLKQGLRRHRQRLRDLDRRVEEVGPEDYVEGFEDVGVDSVADIAGALDAVEGFVDEVTERRDAAQEAVDVLAEIESEEEEEIDELFDGDGYVAETFEEVTDCSYVDVWYDEKDGAVLVERADGRVLGAEALSQGTYDLLYLAIRLKLARELSGGEPGFLVLDSPFVHSDGDRVEREIEVLSELVDEGWQVIYLSFRDTVRDAVEDVADAAVVELQPLDFES